jgi:hypothetical protein
MFCPQNRCKRISTKSPTQTLKSARHKNTQSSLEAAAFIITVQIPGVLSGKKKGLQQKQGKKNDFF